MEKRTSFKLGFMPIAILMGVVVAVAVLYPVFERRHREAVRDEWIATLDQAGRLVEKNRLKEAESRFASLASGIAPDRDPVLYARVYHRLGDIRLHLAASSGNRAEYLGAATDAFEAALTVYTAATHPAEYGAVQKSMGFAYGELAEFRDPKVNLSRAIRADNAALEHFTLEQNPDTFALLKKRLGIAYRNIAPFAHPRENLINSLGAFEASLAVYTPANSPFEHAIIQNNIGAVLSSLGSGTDRKAHMERALTAFRTALVLFDPVRFPMDHALTLNNIGTAHSALAELGNGRENLEQAIRAFKAALKDLPPSAEPKFYNIVQENLLRAERKLEMGSEEISGGSNPS